jgi:acetoacetyl-CoA synthetase
MQQALLASGVVSGDRVVALMPNVPETVIAMLAASSLGAVWSSCSPDFGEQGIIDRFGQIEPKILMACDGYFYNGKTFDILPKVAAVTRRLPSLKKVVIVPYQASTQNQSADISDIGHGVSYETFTAESTARQVQFTPLPFNHPLYILFSSGTTGVPKCIVHSAGGTLLQHVKEHQLHCDIKPDDRVFYFTTCTWMMWNWLVSALASEATLLLYDGSPFYSNGEILFDYADAENMTHFGTSAKFIDALNKQAIHPASSHQLESLRLIASTGSALSPESFEFVYAHIKQDLYLASISGGTDIVSCFVLGNPTAPVYRGEIACKGLAMAVEVWDEQGQSVVQAKGELVCRQPFPSMPLYFWNDPNNEKYHSAYFERFPNVWAHGDFAEITANNGIIIHGRSDTTLNPGGIRIGTAEIYRQVELVDAVLESIAVGQQSDGDERIILFVVLRAGITLDQLLVQKIQQQIRQGASARHVPAVILQVSDIPRTKSGKIAELAVRDVIEGREVKNQSALANPESLALYKTLALRENWIH